MKTPIGGNLAALPKTTTSSPVVNNPTTTKDASASPNHSPSERAPVDAAAAAVPPHGNVPRHILDQIIAQVARAPEAPVSEPLITKSDLAKHYDVSGRTVQRWIASGMPFLWIGKRRKRFRLSQVQLWLQQNHIDRFAAQGIATTMTEVRRRIVNIPILNGLQIVQSPKPPPRAQGMPNSDEGRSRT
jgi:hypothetical protein